MSRGTGEYRARTKVGSYSESENGMIISGKPVDYKFNTSFKNDTANWTLHWSNLTDYQCNQLETTIVYTAVQFTGILYRNNTADCNLPCIGATQRIRVAVYLNASGPPQGSFLQVDWFPLVGQSLKKRQLGD
ncbi:UNVERIFIED_CONTAM: hypothetical protein FKN15_012424 [Acipenser sinensis]